MTPDPTTVAHGAKALDLLAAYFDTPDDEWDAGEWEQRAEALVNADRAHRSGTAAIGLARRLERTYDEMARRP